jgi:hypothetical protein
MTICPHSKETTGICPRCDPAFPQPFLTDGEGQLKWPGISRRDYFAAKALQGLLSASHGDGNNPDGHSRIAFAYADAMIEAGK